MDTGVLKSGAQVDWPQLLTGQTGKIFHGKEITMTDIRTLVYFDIEATGLKSSEGQDFFQSLFWQWIPKMCQTLTQHYLPT